MADRHAGFPAISRNDAQILILGSLPGVLSIERQQYYAHPRNLFWKILGSILNFDPAAPYEQRTEALIRARIALWDVCESAVRAGSLDSAIKHHEVNDFAGFFDRHRQIEHICFNGRKAADIFQRCVHDGRPEPVRGLDLQVLPSTSPAHAGMSFDTKLEHWRSALHQCRVNHPRVPRAGPASA